MASMAEKVGALRECLGEMEAEVGEVGWERNIHTSC